VINTMGVLLFLFNQVKVKFWEKNLRDDSNSRKAKELLSTGENWESKYSSALPNLGKKIVFYKKKKYLSIYCLLAGETPHYQPNKSPIDFLQSAAKCYATAISSSPRENQYHLALGLALEEFFYLEDFFGMKQESIEMEVEGEAEMSSKEEEFLAICKLHGVSSSAQLAIQLKAVEAEYQALKDAGQSHKAEHVQSLYAWKSKKALQVGF